MSNNAELSRRPRLPSEKIARLGRDIYERDIRHQVDSREWAVADGEMTAVNRLREMRLGAVNILCERVGYRGLYNFGGRFLNRPR